MAISVVVVNLDATSGFTPLVQAHALDLYNPERRVHFVDMSDPDPSPVGSVGEALGPFPKVLTGSEGLSEFIADLVPKGDAEAMGQTQLGIIVQLDTAQVEMLAHLHKGWQSHDDPMATLLERVRAYERAQGHVRLSPVLAAMAEYPKWYGGLPASSVYPRVWGTVVAESDDLGGALTCLWRDSEMRRVFTGGFRPVSSGSEESFFYIRCLADLMRHSDADGQDRWQRFRPQRPSMSDAPKHVYRMGLERAVPPLHGWGLVSGFKTLDEQLRATGSSAQVISAEKAAHAILPPPEKASDVTTGKDMSSSIKFTLEDANLARIPKPGFWASTTKCEAVEAWWRQFDEDLEAVERKNGGTVQNNVEEISRAFWKSDETIARAIIVPGHDQEWRAEAKKTLAEYKKYSADASVDAYKAIERLRGLHLEVEKTQARLNTRSLAEWQAVEAAYKTYVEKLKLLAPFKGFVVWNVIWLLTVAACASFGLFQDLPGSGGLTLPSPLQYLAHLFAFLVVLAAVPLLGFWGQAVSRKSQAVDAHEALTKAKETWQLAADTAAANITTSVKCAREAAQYGAVARKLDASVSGRLLSVVQQEFGTLGQSRSLQPSQEALHHSANIIKDVRTAHVEDEDLLDAIVRALSGITEARLPKGRGEFVFARSGDRVEVALSVTPDPDVTVNLTSVGAGA